MPLRLRRSAAAVFHHMEAEVHHLKAAEAAVLRLKKAVKQPHPILYDSSRAHIFGQTTSTGSVRPHSKTTKPSKPVSLIALKTFL